MSGESHLVSIIMPAYNAGNTIAESIEAVISQGYRNWELLVVDDRSTDNTREVISRYASADSRIRPLFLERNTGSPASPRNHGLRLARGRYIAFLDSDDLWGPTKLAVQIAYMERSGATFSCSSYDVVDPAGKMTGHHRPPARASYADLLCRNTIGCLTAVLDSQKVGALCFPVIGHEDYALWLDVASEGHVVHGLPDVLASYRLTPSSVSSNKLRAVRFLWGVYHGHRRYSGFMSAIYVLRFAVLAAKKYKNTL